jgi:hypothetical protein
MSVDFKLDQYGDLAISSGSISQITGLFEVRQRVRIRVEKQLGEWRYNTGSGIPWFTFGDVNGILGSKNKSVATAKIVEVVSGTDGVTSVKVVQSRFDTVTRELVVQLEISTVYGVTTDTFGG